LTDQSASPRPSTTVAKTVDKPGSGTPPGTVAGPATPPAKRVLWAPRTIELGPYITRGQRIEAEVLFLVFPYVALLVLLVGIAIRYAMVLRQPMGARSAVSSAWELFTGRRTWRIGLAITALLHLVGLVLPRAILAWNGAPLRLYLLEGSGFLFGVLALAGWVQIMGNHVAGTAPKARATASEISDTVLLSLFCVAIVSGLATALLYRWGSSWSASTLSPYLQSLARGAPATRLVEDMPFLVRLHVLSWFAVIALVPFTSAALIFVSALDRVVVLIARPVNAGARAGRRLIARLSPARWLWPEEDAVDLSSMPHDGDNAQEPS
jgi:nitrate reductase gamma subunit